MKYKHLECIIEDNGVGMSEGTYQEIMRSLSVDELAGESIGICNVYQRLRMYYEEHFTLSIRKNKKEGITVYLKIPLNMEPEM